MEKITIIGTGMMARSLAKTVLLADRSLQILGRNETKVRDLVESLDPGAAGGALGDPIEGEIVFLAVPYTETGNAIKELGQGLEGRVVVDISNPLDASSFDRMLTPPGISAAEETAELLSGRADVVKAFNTVLSKTLEVGSVAGQHLDVFVAGDSEAAKEKVSAMIAQARMRPIDAGPLRRARELESFMLLIMGLHASGKHEHFNWDTSLRILP
ncbi:NADPH-dependent F420 reductase [Arthrobacter sp. ISL-30]|uniref:NADPH-dependent F420 reductase n=1 Tax=Arthrobacter sp. ISL-30 TaxID=2819109 RepID=UPI001BE77EFD|nr:NAD(P)-binding domain-containing protein [Arthrobacter sp. ISL-30]MBT2515369.1 NAD(P)-binding domain-containing protein [Arthrobacter sp. ISL-30]